MTTNKPTPGPWKVVDDPAFGAYLTVEAEDGRLICDLGDSDVSADEDAANGRLIASAPTMYAVCQALVAFSTHEDYTNWSEREFTERLNAITEQALAAIKQTEG